jgi:C4-dicarboxylate-specific signal transduction histidine kinase
LKSAVKLAEDESVGEGQQLVSELFHALSQPITALRCSLELALYAQSSPSQENLQMALGHAEKIAQLASGIRELVQADDPGDQRVELLLKDCLRGAVLDMVPVAEAAQVKIEMCGQVTGKIIAEPRRLHQALFYLLEFALSSAAPGSVLNVETEAQGAQSLTFLTVSSKKPAANPEAETEAKSAALSRRLGLAIAGRIFESAGGRLQMQEDEQSLRLRFYLPLAN